MVNSAGNGPRILGVDRQRYAGAVFSSEYDEDLGVTYSRIVVAILHIGGRWLELGSGGSRYTGSPMVESDATSSRTEGIAVFDSVALDLVKEEQELACVAAGGRCSPNVDRIRVDDDMGSHWVRVGPEPFRGFAAIGISPIGIELTPAIHDREGATVFVPYG